MQRLRKIQKMRWELDAEIPQEIIANMSHYEGQFLISYDKALSQYMEDIGLDLTIVKKRVKLIRNALSGLSTTS
jgi:hypothetical protein